MDPLQLLVASASQVVVVDDNPRSHARRTPVVVEETKPLADCRWQSSPIVRKPGLSSPSLPYRKRRIPTSTVSSLKNLMAPTLQKQGLVRNRTIPIDFDESDSSDSMDDDNDNNGKDIDKAKDPLEKSARRNRKLKKASELLSEYLRVATEELGSLDCGQDDEGTVSTATLTVSSHNTFDSAASNKSSQSLTSNVRKPVRRRSRDDLLQDLVAC